MTAPIHAVPVDDRPARRGRRARPWELLLWFARLQVGGHEIGNRFVAAHLVGGLGDVVTLVLEDQVVDLLALAPQFFDEVVRSWHTCTTNLTRSGTHLSHVEDADTSSKAIGGQC